MIGWMNTHVELNKEGVFTGVGGWHSVRREATQDDEGYQVQRGRPAYLLYCGQVGVYGLDEEPHTNPEQKCAACELAKIAEMTP